MAKLNLIQLCPDDGQKSMSSFYGVTNMTLEYIRELQKLNGGFGIDVIRTDFEGDETPNETVIEYLNTNVFSDSKLNQIFTEDALSLRLLN